MPYTIRERAKTAINRRKSAGYSTVHIAAVRDEIVQEVRTADQMDEAALTCIIIEECANAAMPVQLEPADLSE